MCFFVLSVSGFSGADCEIDINECESGPCLNGATCMDGVNFYNCLCASGWQGNWFELL